MLKYLAFFWLAFCFVLFSFNSSIAQENITYVLCTKTGCQVQKISTAFGAEIRGKCVGGFAEGSCTITYYSKGVWKKIVYKGNVSKGIITGKGKWTINYEGQSLLETSYEGDFVNGRYEGQGKLKFLYSNKTKITQTGTFKYGMLEGQGEQIDQNGNIYNGEWKWGSYHGQGKYTSKEGVYDGSFINGKYDGHGKMVWANGNWYEGNYINGYREGYGTFHTSSSDQKGYFMRDAFIGASIPEYVDTTNIRYVSNPEMLPPVSKISFYNWEGTPTFSNQSQEIAFKDYSFDLHTLLKINKNTTDDNNDVKGNHYRVSKNKKYYVDHNHARKDVFTVYNSSGTPVNVIYSDYGFYNGRWDQYEVSYSLQKLYAFSEFTLGENRSNDPPYFRIHYFTKNLPVLCERRDISGSFTITKDDKYILLMDGNNPRVLDPNNLNTLGTFNNIGPRATYFDNNENEIILECSFHSHDSNNPKGYWTSYLQYYQFNNKVLEYIGEFPEKKYQTIVVNDVIIGADRYRIFDNYVIIYYENWWDHNGYLRIYNKKTMDLLYSFKYISYFNLESMKNVDLKSQKDLNGCLIKDVFGEDYIKPNNDLSAFLAVEYSTERILNGEKKLVLYNTSDSVAGQKAVIDLNPIATKERLESDKKQLEARKRQNQFNQDINITDQFIFVVNSLDGKDMAEYINSSSADAMQTWDNVNIFIGGTIKNTGKETYKVRVAGKVLFRSVVTALWIFSESQPTSSSEMYTLFEIKPNETKPFLFVNRNVNSGYFLKGSGIGKRLILDDPSFSFNTSEYTGEISKGVIDGEEKLISEFVKNGNIQAKKQGFVNSFYGRDNSVINVYYYGTENSSIFTLYDSNNIKICDYKSSKTTESSWARFVVDENKTYYIGILDKKYKVTTHNGITQLFIDKNGTPTVEYQSK